MPIILISITFSLLLSLGFWQLERANEKRTIENAITIAQSEPAKFTKVDKLTNKEHYEVLLQGYYDNDKQFIYDNQIIDGNAGYYVITPFVLDKNTAILVNRGFVPWYGNREKLVDITINTNKTIIKAKIVKPKERITLKKQNNNAVFPMLIQSLNIEKLSNISGYQLVPLLAQLDVKANNGFYRKWQPFYGSVNKHLGYAMQWFLMAFVLGIIAIRLAIKK